jgi:hypothetical protein
VRAETTSCGAGWRPFSSPVHTCRCRSRICGPFCECELAITMPRVDTCRWGPGVPDSPPGYRNYPKPHSRRRRGESYAAGAHPILGGLHHEYSSRLQVRDRILADHSLLTRHLSLCGCRYSTAALFHTVHRHRLQRVANLTGSAALTIHACRERAPAILNGDN